MFNITVAVSLLLCVATISLWIRSFSIVYSAMHQVLRVNGQQLEIHDYFIRAYGGNLYYLHNITQAPFSPLPNLDRNTAKLLIESQRGGTWFTGQAPWPEAAFNYNPDRWRVPIAPLALFFAALPAIWFRSRRRRRATPGVCRTCRYNLTGNASGVCPECGTAVSSQPGSAA